MISNVSIVMICWLVDDNDFILRNLSGFTVSIKCEVDKDSENVDEQ